MTRAHTSARPPLLEVVDLQVAYGGISAVRGVSFSVVAGDTVVMLGANGAGKTTTLRALSGLVAAAGGEVRFDGRSLLGLGSAAIARLGIAHVPAGRALFGSLTVSENLRMGLVGSRRDGLPEAREDVDRVLTLFPVLRDRRNQQAGTLSGGQQQMLAIARALVQAPRLLMLDEMSMGLAPNVVQELFDVVAQLRGEGVTVLMVEQFIERALAVADYAVVLEQGVVVAAGPPAALARDDVARAYLGKEQTKLEMAPISEAHEIAVALGPRELQLLERRAQARGLSLADLTRTAVDRWLAEEDGLR